MELVGFYRLHFITGLWWKQTGGKADEFSGDVKKIVDTKAEGQKNAVIENLFSEQ